MAGNSKQSVRYFEDIEEGETHSVRNARTITGADIQAFAGLTGDFSRIHVSEEFARTESPFDGRIAHGQMIDAIVEGHIIENLSHALSYGHDNVRFVEPVYPGDTLSMKREVVETTPYDDRYGRVVYNYEAENQRGDCVLVDDHILLVERRDQ